MFLERRWEQNSWNFSLSKITYLRRYGEVIFVKYRLKWIGMVGVQYSVCFMKEAMRDVYIHGFDLMLGGEG